MKFSNSPSGQGIASMKNLKLSVLLALLLIASAGSLRAQTHYTVTHLGLGIAQAINNRGQVTGEHDPATGVGTGGAFIYFNGQLQDLPSIYGGAPTSGNAINDHGQVAGVAHPYDEYIWLFTAGHMKNLGVGYPLSINNLGTIVGYKYAGRDSDNNVLFRAVISYNGGPLQVLRNMENFNGVAIGINDLNQVVGNSIYGQVAFIWQNGQVTYLPRIDSVSDYMSHSRSIIADILLDSVTWVGLITFTLFCISTGSTRSLPVRGCSAKQKPLIRTIKWLELMSSCRTEALMPLYSWRDRPTISMI